MPSVPTRRVRRTRRNIKKAVRRSRFRTKYVNNVVHSFKRMTPMTTITGNAVNAPYQSTSNVKFSNLINYGEFTSLFDQFRINYVVIKFYLRIDPSAQSSVTASYPRLYWVRDYNSGVILSLPEMRERASCKQRILLPNKPVVMKFKPNLLSQSLYQVAGTSNYTPVWKQWIDTGSASANYYGTIWNIDDLTNTNYKLDIETTYYFQCKNTL